MEQAARVEPERTAGGDAATRRRAWAVTAMIVALMMINFGDKAVLGLAARPIMKELGLTATEFGGLSSAFYLLFSLSALCVGFISSRVSTKAILGTIAILWSIVTVPILVAATVPVLYLSRILLGAAEGPTAAMAAHAVQKWFPEDKRAIPTAMTTMGGGLGLVVTAPLLGYFIANHGWRSGFLVLAIIGAVWFVVWQFVGREGPYSDYESGKGDGRLDAGDEGAVPETRVSYRRLLGNRTFLGGLVAGVGAYWALAFGTAWLPALLEEARGYSAQTASFLVALPPALSTVAILALPFVAERLIRRGVPTRLALAVLSGLVVAVSGVAGLFVGGTHGTVMIVLICVTVGLPGAYYAMWFLSVARISPVAQRGAVLGTGLAIVTLTGVIAPFVTGKLLDAAGGAGPGFGTVFTVTSVLLIVCGLVGAVTMDPDREAERFGLRRAG